VLNQTYSDLETVVGGLSAEGAGYTSLSIRTQSAFSLLAFLQLSLVRVPHLDFLSQGRRETKEFPRSAGKRWGTKESVRGGGEGEAVSHQSVAKSWGQEGVRG